MNKLTKGSLATGAGLVLLLGGTGTFMSWNDSSTANGGTVAAGHLTIAEDTVVGSWSSSISGGIGNIATHEIVPGETLTYTANMNVSAMGDNLKVTTGLTGNSIKANVVGDTQDDALAALLTTSAATPTITSPNFAETTTAGVYDVTEGAGVVTVSTKIALPADAPTTVQDGKVDLTAMTVTLNQTTA